MKKILILMAILGLFLCVFTVSVYAEEEVEPAEPVAVEEDNAWENFVKEWFSAEKVAMYLSWIAYIGTIIGLVANLKKLKASNNLTLKNVTDEVKDAMEQLVGAEMGKQVEKFLPNLVEVQAKTNDILKTFSKILALSQENSPESRVAILQLIEDLGTAGKEVVENAKEVIEQEVEAVKEHKEVIEAKLDKIIEEYDGTSI